MLEEDGFEALANERVFFLDSEESKDVSIFGGDMVCLYGVVVELAVVGEV